MKELEVLVFVGFFSAITKLWSRLMGQAACLKIRANVSQDTEEVMYGGCVWHKMSLKIFFTQRKAKLAFVYFLKIRLQARFLWWQEPGSCVIPSQGLEEKRVLANTQQRKTYLCLHTWHHQWDGSMAWCPWAPRSLSVALCYPEMLLAWVTLCAENETLWF